MSAVRVRIMDRFDSKKSPPLTVALIGERKSIFCFLQGQCPRQLVHNRIIVTVANEKDAEGTE